MRRGAAWTIVALGVLFILEAAMFTWWSSWTSGIAQFAGGVGCIYGGIALIKLEPFRASSARSHRGESPSSRPRTPT